MGKFNKNGEVIFEKGGVFSVIAEALDGSGIKGRLEVIIDSVPDAAGAISGDDSLCRGSFCYVRTYTIPEIRGASAYIWTLPNGVTDTTAINEITAIFDSKAVSGNIRVKGHNIYADGNESRLYINVNEIPPTPVITLKDGILHSDVVDGNQWYMDSNRIPGATESIYIPEQNGKYYVKVTLNDCPSKASNTIQYLPTTGIELTSNSGKIVIYPNPTTGQLEISLGTNQVRQATVNVYNLQGKLVYSEAFQNTTIAGIDLTVFPKGMYIVKIITDENNYNGKVCLRINEIAPPARVKCIFEKVAVSAIISGGY